LGLSIIPEELFTGALDDGALLFHLVTALSGKEVGKLVQPKTRAHKLDNITITLNFLKEDGVRLIGIGAEGIAMELFVLTYHQTFSLIMIS
jgi:hypothetical protein